MSHSRSRNANSRRALAALETLQVGLLHEIFECGDPGRVQQSRRSFLSAIGAASGSLLWGRAAEASLARGLTLRELVRASSHSVVVTPLASTCQWAVFGGRKLIVTETRVRIEDLLAPNAPAERELIVRVLGGTIGKLGQRIEGQAELVLGQPSAVFLTSTAPLLAFVTGAAQGHYPLRADGNGVAHLVPSPHVELTASSGSAVERLSGSSLDKARELVRAELP